MQYKKAANTRMIFASAVPLTVLAFYLGSFSLNAGLFDLRQFQVWDGIAIFCCAVGVLMYNMVEEPKQKVSVEKIN